jgi:hypothetical protein
MLQICKESGFKPVLITTPLSESYLELFPEEMTRKFHQDLNDIRVNFPNVPYLDYESDERFYTHTELFYDSQHLNQAGGELFTLILAEDLQRLGLLG